jgi:predicted nucleotidyltransferase
MKREVAQNIGDALFPKIKRQLLSLFYVTPGKRYYFREITRLIKASSGVVTRELATLTKAGILKSELSGRQRYYWADPDCMIYADLRNIVVRTFGVASTVKNALKPVSSDIKVAFLYGSIPAGTDTGHSDIDMMVVGEISFRKLVAALKSAEQELNRELNPTLFSSAEFKKRLKDSDHFIGTVMGSPKIFIMGNADDLAGLAK